MSSLPPGPDEAEGSRARILGTLVAIGLGLLVHFLLRDSGLRPEAQRLSGLVVATVAAWLFEVSSPAIVSLAFATGAMVLRVAPAESIFAPFANPIIYFFLGSFFLARAIEIHGVATTLLARTLALPGVRGRPERAAAILVAGTGLLSAFLNNTAAAALFLPFATALARHAFRGHPRARTKTILGVSYAASVGGLLTTFGTAPTLLAIGILRTTTSHDISFLDWFRYALPVAVPLLGFLVWRALAAGPAERAPEAVAPVAAEPLTRAGRRSLALVGLAMALLVGTSSLPALKFLGEAGAIMVPALLLFFLPRHDGRHGPPLLTWSEAAQIDWQSLLLFGGGLSMGALLFSTGVAQALGASLAPLAAHPRLFFACLVLLMLLLTEIASNTASVTLLVPIVVASCEAAALPTPVFVAAMALTASLGYMLPVGTPPNALAYGTGLVSGRQMLREGALVDLLGYLLVVASFFAFHLG